MNRNYKWFFAIVVLIFIGYYWRLYNQNRKFVQTFTDRYTKGDLIKNYDEKSKQITEVRKYINSIVPAGMIAEIEFEKSSDDFDMFHIEKDGKWKSNWSVEYDSPKADSLLQELGWTRETVETLRSKLDDANCISIQSGQPTTVGFQRNGMGKYFYKVFNTTLSDSLIQEYNDGCQYIYYKDNIVLEYGGGAVGPQCFEGFTGGKK